MIKLFFGKTSFSAPCMQNILQDLPSELPTVYANVVVPIYDDIPYIFLDSLSSKVRRGQLPPSDTFHLLHTFYFDNLLPIFVHVRDDFDDIPLHVPSFA
jgi:hypothetical protein